MEKIEKLAISVICQRIWTDQYKLRQITTPLSYILLHLSVYSIT